VYRNKKYQKDRTEKAVYAPEDINKIKTTIAKFMQSDQKLID